MKILVTGGYGQLGSALKSVLDKEEVLFTDSDSMDITDAIQVERVFSEFKPEWLMHGAALTNVDGCEENPDLAEKINHLGTKILAEACKKHDCEMIYVSTDYVFDGTKGAPYTEEDKPNPKSVYGRTKLEGEKEVQKISGGYIIRTAWVYGEGHNFVKTMLKLSQNLDEIKVVNDQFGRPTYAPDLAKAIYDVIKKRPEKGIYNVTGDGDIISWADFAKKIFELSGKKTRVTPISTKEYFEGNQNKKIAPRPAYSALDLVMSKKAGLFLPEWKNSLKNYL